MKTKICPKCKTELPATTEYFSLNKCHKNGLNCWCKKCCKKYQQSEKGKQYQRKYRQSEKYKQVIKKSQLKQYGITLGQYNKMFEAQNGVCAICSKINENGRRLSVDHSHKTGKVRGLLCNNCNKAVGLLQDNPKTLRKAANYLEKL